jgi:hypothetical protein
VNDDLVLKTPGMYSIPYERCQPFH